MQTNKKQPKLLGNKKAAVLALTFLFIVAMMTPAALAIKPITPHVATQVVRQYSASITPTTVDAGTTGSYTLIITNPTSSTKEVGSVTVAVPSGFTITGTITATISPTKAWIATLVSGVIQLRGAPSGTNKLLSGEAVTVTFSATAPTAAGTYEWTTIAYSGTDYTDANFNLIGSQPAVTVVARYATICGTKFFDADFDGVKDETDVGIKGFKIELYLWSESAWGASPINTAYTDENGAYSFTVETAGRYKIVEVLPNEFWLQTYPATGYYDISVTLGNKYENKNFGNICVHYLTSGKSIGFWGNKNGQDIITANSLWTILDSTSCKYYNPTNPSTAMTFASAQGIKDYLPQAANSKEMRFMLSAQLIAAQLNVELGYLSSGTTVYVGPKNVVTDPANFVTVGSIINGAINALNSDSSTRADQEYWKNLLDGINNNIYGVACTAPCTFSYV